MSPRVRAVAGFKRFTDPQLVTTGRGVVKEIFFFCDPIQFRSELLVDCDKMLFHFDGAGLKFHFGRLLPVAAHVMRIEKLHEFIDRAKLRNGCRFSLWHICLGFHSSGNAKHDRQPVR